jgi:hypothetical protein
MTVSVQWDNDAKTIIHFETSGHWTPEEFHAGLLRLRQMVAAAIDRPTGILFSPNGTSPTGLFMLLRIGLRFCDEIGLPCVMISPAEFDQRFYDILTRYNPLDSLRFAPGVDEGRNILQTSSTS